VPDLDPAFASLISKAMARDMNQRFQSTADFIKALDGWMQRGTAVTVPPTADPAAAALIPAGALSAKGQVVQGPGTGGTWATSQPGDELPIKKGPSAGLIAGVTVGMLLLGGAAAYAMLGGKKSADDPAPAASPAPVEAPSPVEAKAVPAAPVVEPAVPAASVVPPPSASTAVVALPSASPAGQAPIAKGGSKPVRPVGGAKPTAKPGTKPGSTPDFGY
jgi:hypothetical protein